MHASRTLIHLLLVSTISGLGCTPTTVTELETDTETELVASSNISLGFSSTSRTMIEGGTIQIPIDVRNTGVDMETVTASIDSDLPGFSTNGERFSIATASNVVVVLEFDATDMEVEIGQPQTRSAVVLIATNSGEEHELFVLITIIDELDYTEDQLNIWSTSMYMDAEAGGSAVVSAYTVSSNWNEDVSYTATVEGVGCTVTKNGSGTMTAGSSNQIWTQYTPPAAMADPAHETEQYLCLLTISAADMVHEVTVRITLNNPDYGVGDDDGDSGN